MAIPFEQKVIAVLFSLALVLVTLQLIRTHRLREGAHLSEVTGEIARAWGVEVNVLPATADRFRTTLTLAKAAALAPGEYPVEVFLDGASLGIREFRFNAP